MKKCPVLYERTIYTDLSVAQLIQEAIARGEGVLAANGALSVQTGKRTGRSPKDRFIVKTIDVADQVAWGTTNQPIQAKIFASLWHNVRKII